MGIWLVFVLGIVDLQVLSIKQNGNTFQKQLFIFRSRWNFHVSHALLHYTRRNISYYIAVEIVTIIKTRKIINTQF